MAQIKIDDLSFCWPGAAEPVFSHVNLSLDTSWRLGLIGRNGRGKTTFLKLLMTEQEYTGNIYSPEEFEYFPVDVKNETQPAITVARAIIAPFDEWEKEMDALIKEGTESAIEKYGEIEEQYAAADGYVIDEMITAEISKLGMLPSVLRQGFNTLSGGEKVKLMLAALFLKKHRFLLIDEPTDHLDIEGRKTVANWLSGKSGFILVSHDRGFLDQAVDHVLSINRADIELQKGGYSSWRQNREMQDAYEHAENKRLAGDIKRLKEAAKRTESWSNKVEKSKKGNGGASYNGGPPSLDRGHIGRQAARMMQRSKSIQRRQTKEIEEKQGLLKNVEEAQPLKFSVIIPEKNPLISMQDITLYFGERQILNKISFDVESGQRIAVKGANGSGKSSLLKLLLGQLQPSGGTINRLSNLVISSLPQDAEYLYGELRGFAEAEEINLSLFMAILRKLDFERDAFEQPMQTYSAGQKKKVCLASSLAKPAHLFLWDEPLNYIDVLSREQIEEAILQSKPTMIFVEHDAAFIKNVATESICLG